MSKNIVEDTKMLKNNSQFPSISHKRRIIIFFLLTILFIFLIILFNKIVDSKILNIVLIILINISGLFLASVKYQITHMFKKPRKIQSILYLISIVLYIISIFINVDFLDILFLIIFFILYFLYYFTYIPFLKKISKKIFSRFKDKKSGPLIES